MPYFLKWKRPSMYVMEETKEMKKATIDKPKKITSCNTSLHVKQASNALTYLAFTNVIPTRINSTLEFQ